MFGLDLSFLRALHRRLGLVMAHSSSLSFFSRVRSACIEREGRGGAFRQQAQERTCSELKMSGSLPDAVLPSDDIAIIVNNNKKGRTILSLDSLLSLFLSVH